MHTFVLADITETLDAFGITSWEPFAAHLIAFIVVVILLRVFAFKPIQAMLEKRRERIIEGENMRAESERRLAGAHDEETRILAGAREEGRQNLARAKETAEKVLAEKTDEASASARQIIERSREAAELEAQRDREHLKAEFGRLVAQATAQVTGKVLTEEDHRRINAEAISQL